MKLIDELVARAVAAENEAGKLAEHQAGVLDRQKAYDRLEQLFEAAAADGQLSGEELENLMKSFRAAGLDTGTLEELYKELQGMDSTQGVDVENQLRTRIADQLHQARVATDTDPMFEFNTQRVTAEYYQSLDLAARVSKSEHDMYMTAVRNLVA